MIIAILFFSLASAVCIQLFARSHLLSTQTVNQNHAVVQAQNLACSAVRSTKMPFFHPPNRGSKMTEQRLRLL